jgi:hypothetical protein
MPFVKLDTAILESTLWIDRAARDIFITALLMAEPREITKPMPQYYADRIEQTGFSVPPGWYGFVAAAGVGIARRAFVEQDEAMRALETLGSTDPHSRSPEFGGRRLVRVDGGFIVLNFFKYRDKDYTAAERMAKLRARRKAQEVTANSDAVTRNSDAADADADATSQILSSAKAEGNGSYPHAKHIEEIWQFYLAESGMSPVRTQFTRQRRQKIQRWFEYFLNNNCDTQGLPEKAAKRVMAVIQGTCRDSYVSQNKSWLTIESILGSQDKIDKGLARYEQQEGAASRNRTKPPTAQPMLPVREMESGEVANL